MRLGSGAFAERQARNTPKCTTLATHLCRTHSLDMASLGASAHMTLEELRALVARSQETMRHTQQPSAAGRDRRACSSGALRGGKLAAAGREMLAVLSAGVSCKRA